MASGDAGTLDITEAVESGSWCDTPGDVIGKLTLKLANVYVKDQGAYLESLIPNGTLITMTVEGDGDFKGLYKVRKNTFDYSVSGQHISITAFDRLFNFSKCRESWYYTQDKSTDWLLNDIFTRGETKLEYDYVSTTHPLILTRNEAMLDEITDIIDKAYTDAGEEKPILIMDGDTAKITTNGWQDEIFEFKDTEANTLDKGNIISITRDADITNIITRVNMKGKELEDQTNEDLGSIDGHTEYDVLQYVIYQDQDGTAEDLQKEAARKLRDEGEQVLNLSIVTVDVHKIRKGHKIRLSSASGINGEYYVLGVTHDVKARTMSMTLESAEKE